MEEINLYKLLGFYARNWLLILSLTLAGLGAGLIYNQFIQTPMYKSNATLLVIKDSGAAQDTTLLNNYVQLFQSRRVLEPVIQSQKLDMNFEQLIGNVSASNDKSTEVLRLSVSTNDPAVSQKFLAAAVDRFQDEAEELYDKRNIIVVDSASEAVPPYNVNKPLQLAIASGAGFVVSLLVLFFIYDARGGKVDDWGKRKKLSKKGEATKATPAPRTKAKKVPTVETAVSGASKTKQRTGVSATVANLWKKFTTSAKNSLWIEETDLDARSRDDTKD